MRSTSSVQLAGIFSMLAFLASCGGRAEHSGDSHGNQQAGGETGAAGRASSGGGAPTAAGGASGAGAGASGQAGAATGTCSPGGAPLRRLTHAEYMSTLSALFGDLGPLATQFPEEGRFSPVGNRADHQLVYVEQASAYFETAKELAARATRGTQALSQLAPCAAEPTPDTACASTVIESFASKAFRRAATQEELAELLALHTSIVSAGGDFADATRAVIVAVLQAPEFLYRIEWGTGEGPRPDVSRLTGDEMATRLSYLFWGSSPDDALRVAAKSGALLEPAGIEKQAQRLRDDSRSRASIASFFDDFLGLYRVPLSNQNDPAYSPELGAALEQSTLRFLDSQIFDHDQPWPAVLTSSKAFVNGPIASFYGLQGVTGNELQEVTPSPVERLGLLTQPGVLMAANPGRVTNPTERGYWLMQRILCRDIPPEPPDVTTSIIDDPVEPLTTRQRWLLMTSSAACVACHRDMDQLGFALENFDTLGRFRSTENNLPIDTKIDVTGLGPTTGPVELVKALAASPDTGACFARRFAEFGLGKSLDDDSGATCLKQDIARRFEATGYNVRKLLLDLTHTDAFLYLPKDR